VTVAILSVLGLCIAACLLAGRSALRRSLAGLCLVLASALAFQRSLSPVVREMLTFTCIVGVLKCVQIATSSQSQWTVAKRIWSALVFFDVRQARAASGGWDKVMLIKVVLYPLVLVGAVVAPLQYSSHLSATGSSLLEWFCGVAFAYAVLDWAVQVLRLVHRLVGLDIGPLHRDPILSCSLSEFWGERWNLPVAQWLNEFCFRPWARRGHASAGIGFAFLVSAALHFWLFFAAANLLCGVLGATFFLIQAPALLLERRWRIKRWPMWARRAWTAGFILAASPLLTIPMRIGLEMQLNFT
jgi:hypothetical protein